MKRIALYGGSFDPIHLGHVSLALEMREKHRLDEVHFCPANRSPLKESGPYAGVEDRLHMVRAALAGFDGLYLCEIEAQGRSSGYSVDTLRLFIETRRVAGEQAHYFLIIGEDSAAMFHRWREPDVIVQLSTVLVGRRSLGGLRRRWSGPPAVSAALRQGETPTRVIEVSSSEIRERLNDKLPVAHLLSHSVNKYIITNNLYQQHND